ncbi:hypothetical protein RchiOBHm_Chr7g0193031 [Rosa chinensis]|uniref:Uncharacterized protein n=1 Tax=Rosa chinensis TaxID=74649 RepID=A0A2P6P5R4_ROSCH|nr:hypothetical protein RchiOBHm_Chr7g0193031 [Rosa chinensis]
MMNWVEGWVLELDGGADQKIEGNNASADDAIMLDKDDYVSETNATNIVSLWFTYMDNRWNTCMICIDGYTI